MLSRTFMSFHVIFWRTGLVSLAYIFILQDYIDKVNVCLVLQGFSLDGHLISWRPKPHLKYIPSLMTVLKDTQNIQVFLWRDWTGLGSPTPTTPSSKWSSGKVSLSVYLSVCLRLSVCLSPSVCLLPRSARDLQYGPATHIPWDLSLSLSVSRMTQHIPTGTLWHHLIALPLAFAPVLPVSLFHVPTNQLASWLLWGWPEIIWHSGID